MKIQKIPVASMNPAKYNPRKDLKPGDPEYDKLKRSIDSFGYIEPIVWNERTGNIVGGHQRFKILLEEGVKEIECVVVDYGLNREKLANVALNKVQGKFEQSTLELLIKELSDISIDDLDAGDPIDLSLTGLDDLDIDTMLEDIDIIDDPELGASGVDGKLKLSFNMSPVQIGKYIFFLNADWGDRRERIHQFFLKVVEETPEYKEALNERIVSLILGFIDTEESQKAAEKELEQ